MSKTPEDLLIIYELEAEQWASYLRSLLAGSIPEAGICCYDIAMITSRRDNVQQLSGYKCKLLILSRGMLEGLCQTRRAFLSRVLQPEARVVVLLCGVDSLAPLLDLVPLEGKECLLISSEQDAQEYHSAVAEIVRRGRRMSEINPGLERKLSAGISSTKCTLLLLPNRVPCENPGEVFLLLRESVAGKDCEVEFSGAKEKARVKPVNWNENTLRVEAADFPAGSVGVTLYCGGVIKAKARLLYYSSMGEIERLLKQAVDPINFMRQAFHVSSTASLDQILASCLMQKMPTGGFHGLTEQTATHASRLEDIPTLLHFAAQHGLKDLTSILLQCPGAQQALRTSNRMGHTPLVLAHTHGHAQLQTLLQETLAKSSEEDDDDSSVYELMGSAGSLKVTDTQNEAQSARTRDGDEQHKERVEGHYAQMGSNEDYDTILTANSSVVLANRPPAPTPRPESLPNKEDNTPFIAQVFQKKKSLADSETLYSLPTKQNRGRHSMSCTYDTVVLNPAPGLDELIKLQEQVKKGYLSMDEAMDRFSDWQRLQRGLDSIQQEKLQQLRTSIINNRVDDDSVYDKINIVHHTPPAATNECRSGSQEAGTEFYSKPLKGQHSSFFWKADKR
ncbi:B-cell scaffold protein with ankyrin repeats-like [Hoplias malabaricus]|uniref:B-cell scaffold protein with ankyrin repeats-like n=1 Tax=Hoplias malabaricus TaxID=27720 RepID=UPI003462B96A